MPRPSRLPPSCAPLLLSAAAVVDLVVALALTSIFIDQLEDPLQRLPYMPDGGAFPLLFAIIVLTLWIVCEGFLGGRTIGRSVLGLFPRDAHGKPLRGKTNLRRASGKVATLGLTGANPFAPARYDEKSGVIWHSPIAAPEPRPVPNWRIIIRDGSLKGRSSSLNSTRSFAKDGKVRFGRQEGWSDVLFGASDRAVSNRHCVLSYENGQLFLQDGDGQGTDSKHGTFLGNRRLNPGRKARVGSAKSFSVANIRIDIDR